MSTNQPILSTDRLSHNFGSYWALKDVGFSLNKGDFLFLFGPSGAGKTTLMRLLYADLAVRRGAARIAGFNLKGLKKSRIPALRRQVSVVFQDFKILPHRTAVENVALALEVRGLAKRQIDRRVRATLRGLQLENKADCPCSELSGGEQQRVAIARSVAVNPSILLADEPTGNLDRELALRLMEVFKQFNSHGATIILATHNRDLLQAVDGAKTLTLRAGRIIDSQGVDATVLPVAHPGEDEIAERAGACRI